MISEVWNKFIHNSISCYKPGENLTADKQLFSTKVRCRFLQFMSNKPDKFGIKVWLCVDVDSKYLCNSFSYLGRDESRPQNQSLGECVVLRLMDLYLNTGRNITTDNFSTSVSLAKKLIEKRTTTNKTRRNIPATIKTAFYNILDLAAINWWIMYKKN